MRVQPDFGTVTQLPLPRRPDSVRLTVRLSPDAAEHLAELAARVEKYKWRPAGYQPDPVLVRSLVVTKSLHEFLHRESVHAGLTVNGLINKLLEDPELTIS